MSGIGSYVAGIADQSGNDDFLEATHYTETVVAPAIGDTLTLHYVPIVEGTLTLTAGATTYTESVDFGELSNGFTNLTIPQGTSLTADYFYYDAASEGAVNDPPEDWRLLTLSNGWSGEARIYREGGRAYLSGVILGGATTAGATLFAVDSDLAPDRMLPLAALSDSGPVRLELGSDGALSISSLSPPLGNGWLIIEGLSWRCREVLIAFLSWAQTDIFFDSAALDKPYSELS